MRCPRPTTSSYRILGWPKIKPSPEGLIFWHIVNFTDDMPKQDTIDSFDTAFSIWQVAFDEIEPEGRAITFESTSDYSKAHIKLFFVNPGLSSELIQCDDGNKRNVKIPVPMDGKGKVLAYVPYGQTNIFFDEGEKWAEMTNMTGEVEVSLFDISLHEIGHTLDLGHSKLKNALMGPWYDGTPKKITNDDLEGTQKIWGGTKEKIMDSNISKYEIKERASKILLIEMLKYYGMKEVPGPGSNNKLITIMRQYVNWVEDDSKLSWCSIMMDYICKENGIERPDSPAAVDWKKVGEPIDFENIQIGDVVVFFRTTEINWQGHVAIFVNHDQNENFIWTLGGNQSNAVNIQMQKVGKIRKDGIRRLRFVNEQKEWTT